MKVPILLNVNYQMLLEIQKTIVTLSQIQSSEGIIHRKITSGNIAMKIHFQGKIGSRKQKGTFTSDINTRLSQEMDSMMSMMHTQINRTKISVLAERVVPEIQNIVSSMSFSGNKDTESGLSPDIQEVKEDTIGITSKITKKDCLSAVDPRDNRDHSPYN